jgi:hypothetical protein
MALAYFIYGRANVARAVRASGKVFTPSSAAAFGPPRCAIAFGFLQVKRSTPRAVFDGGAFVSMPPGLFGTLHAITASAWCWSCDCGAAPARRGRPPVTAALRAP